MTYTQAMALSDYISELQSIRFTNTNNPTSTQLTRWINHAYARIWNADEWIFKYTRVSDITVTSGTSTVSNTPADLGIPIGIWRDDGYPLMYLPPKAFYNIYAGATDTASPAFYTMFNQEISIGPISNESSSSFSMVYEQRLTNLVTSSDSTALPAQHHYLVVIGALSLGLQLYNDFTWEFQEQSFQQGIQDMRKDWLVDQRGEVTTWGRDGVEALPTYWGI